MAEDERENGVSLTGTAFDQDLYGGSDRSGLNRSAYAVDDEDPDDQLDEL